MQAENPLRILFVEDLPSDVELAERALHQAGIAFSSRTVETQDAFLHDLRHFHPELIISDYALPAFDGMHALRLSLEHDSTLPVIILTGSMNEETAVACMKAGAADYVLKEHVSKLPVAVRNALERKEVRAARHEAEHALREKEERLQSIFRAVPAGIGVVIDRVFTEINQRFCEMIGYTADELIGQSARMIYPSDADYERVGQEKYRQIRRDGIGTVETRFQCKDGAILDILMNSTPLNRADLSQGVLFIALDITERKVVERALQASEEKYRQIVENAQEGIWIIDADNITTFVNAQMADMLGYTVEEMLGRSLFAFIDEDNRVLAEADIERRRRGMRERHEFIFQRKDGAPLWTLISTHPLFDEQGQYYGAQAMVTDITALKQTQQAEHEQRMLAEALTDTSNALINMLDFDEVMKTILDHVGRVVPHDAANIMLVENDWARTAYWRNYPPRHDAFFSAFRVRVSETSNLQEMLVTGQPFVIPYTAHYPGWIRDPNTEWVKSYLAAPIRSHGQVVGFLNVDSSIPGHFNDVHAQRLLAFADQVSIAIEHAQLYEQIQHHAEELEQRVIERTAQLNHAKERTEAILNSSTDVMILCRTDGCIEQVNPAFGTAFGCDPDSAHGQPLSGLIIPDDERALDQAFAAVLEKHRPQRLEVTIHCAPRTTFDADVVLFPIVEQDDHLLGVVCSLRDMTARKQLESQLRVMLKQAMELSELKSRYVSMAAHDLRNPLAVIRSSIDLLKTYSARLSDDQKNAKYDRIIASIKVMVELLDDILTLGKAESGKLAFEPAPLDVIAFCERVVEETQHAADTARRIAFICTGQCDHTRLDAKLLRHILGNLLSNAIKYSSDDSVITFKVECALDEITFCIQDQGIGIPEADQKRLFEAFHRADNARQMPGTGLGLAIVKQSVDLHRGTITWESAEGRGTTFTVTLPADLQAQGEWLPS